MSKIQLFYKKKFGFGNKKNDIVKLGKIENDKFYEWKSYNKFSKKGEKIPKWNKIDVPKRVIETFFEGKNEKNMKELMKLSKKKHYFTEDNGGQPFCVYIIGKKVQVYKETKLSNWKNIIYKKKEADFMMDWFDSINLPDNIKYTDKVADFNPQKIYIGKSPMNKMTKYSGGYGDKWDGNSILLKLTGNNYIYIGETVTQFKLRKGDSVKNYWSPVGNNRVPYPFIQGKNYVYFMIDMRYISNKKLFEGVDMKEVDFTDLTDIYYKNSKQFHSKYFRKKQLQKRMW